MRIIHVMIFVLAALFLSGCQDDIIPKEFNLGNPSYKQRVSHLFGPGGINHSFNVFDLDQNIASEIAGSGIEFLNNMPSVVNFPDEKQEAYRGEGFYNPYRVPFAQWKKLPILKDYRWPRRSYSALDTDQPMAIEFFGDKKRKDFTPTIDAEHLALFHQIIHSGQGYYAYGGYRENCIMVISPKFQKVYYLFRD